MRSDRALSSAGRVRARRSGFSSLRGATRRLGRDERGVALVELAIVSSVLLLMVLGVLEFGNVYSSVHTLTSLSREGANLAARGATLPQALDNVMTNGGDLQLASKGGALVSRIAVRNGQAEVEDQVASPGYDGWSRLGAKGGPASGVGPWGLAEDQLVYAVEIFYRYDALTPFEGMFGVGVPDTLYERGIF